MRSKGKCDTTHISGGDKSQSVLRLTKNPVPGTCQSALSANVHEEPHPKGPVCKSAFSIDAHKKPCPLGPVCLSQRDMCDSSQSHFFCQELLSIEHDSATCYL